MFDQRLRDFTQSAQGDGSELCLVMADIDYFKKFNDTYGHQLGDLVLRLVARALTEGVKGRDLVTRYGGEEFAILLPQTKLNDALGLGEQLRRTIGARHIVQRGEARDLGNVTLSMGVSRWHPGEPVVEFVQRADAALYFAKRHGRNRVCSERDLQTGAASAAPTPAPSSAGR
jgi:diguanylate cyclase